ncbi:hypothetical protein [Aliarcobacter butzleri]|uniref:hypothetical protein n=1 Tax=Aliarcobacter butzleri TaxID=28197 RepID=UPI001269C599|nr:hypothetical protein [Aliarcobacter butzleri]
MNNDIMGYTKKEACRLIEKFFNASSVSNATNTGYYISFDVTISNQIPFCLNFVFDEQYPTFIIQHKNTNHIESLISHFAQFNCKLFGNLHKSKDGSYWQEGRLEIDLFKQQ